MVLLPQCCLSLYRKLVVGTLGLLTEVTASPCRKKHIWTVSVFLSSITQREFTSSWFEKSNNTQDFCKEIKDFVIRKTRVPTQKLTLVFIFGPYAPHSLLTVICYFSVNCRCNLIDSCISIIFTLNLKYLNVSVDVLCHMFFKILNDTLYYGLGYFVGWSFCMLLFMH